MMFAMSKISKISKKNIVMSLLWLLSIQSCDQSCDPRKKYCAVLVLEIECSILSAIEGSTSSQKR